MHRTAVISLMATAKALLDQDIADAQLDGSLTDAQISGLISAKNVLETVPYLLMGTPVTDKVEFAIQRIADTKLVVDAVTATK